jgi:hypothetical protein
MQDLDKILEHADRNEGGWVVQKYIENPLIVMGRKFDIRLWYAETDGCVCVCVFASDRES